MSSYRAPGGDSFRPGPPRARRDSDRDFDREYYRSRSPPLRRRSPPSEDYRVLPREAAGMAPHDVRRGWNDRRDRDYPRGYDRRYGRRSSLPYDDNEYPSRGRGGYRSSYSSRSRSRSRSCSRRGRSRSRSPGMGRPCREIKLDGFPSSMTENDIARELESSYDVPFLEDVRVIRDRKHGRTYAFITFPDVDMSQAFMNDNFPSIWLGEYRRDGTGETQEVGLAYSRQVKERPSEMERLREMERLSEIERLLEIERLENSSENEWICAECDQPVQGHRCGQCHADHPTRERKFTVQNRAEVGDKDASPDGTPSQYLLVRQLAGNVTEEVLAKGLEKLYKGAGTSGTSDAASTKPKAKVISTTSTANLGAPVGSLRRVLFIRSKHNWQSCRYGFAEFFTAEDAKAAMAKFKALDTITISSKPITLAYAHSGVFMPASEANPDYAFKSAANPSQLLKYWNREAFAREFTVALSASEPSVRSEHPNANPVAAVTNDQGTLQNVKDKETKSKKRKAEGEVTAAKKKTIPSHLQFWQDRRAELHGVKPENGEKNDRQYSTNPSSDPIPPPDTEVDDSPSLEYGDPNRKCCYLCMRKFQTISETIKHERLSALHQKNLKDARTRLMALARVRKFVPKLHSAISQTPAYRDRAAERRQVYNQPKFAPIKMGFKKKQAASTERSPSSDETAAAPSKGASLLGKMGYVEGQGLGATGEGRTAPIETEMYREGVGLGAEGGKVGDAAKEAARNTRGNYNEFLEKTREKAQERYNSMMK